MKLLDVVNGVLNLTTEALMVPAFRNLWSNLDSDMGLKELTYVYLIADFNTPYKRYVGEEREQIVSHDVFKDEKWKPSQDVIDAIAKYRELTITPSMTFLESVYIATKKLEDYFRNADFTKLDMLGKQLYDPDKVMANAARAGKVLESLTKLTQLVQKEIQDSNVIRGGGEVGQFES